MYDESLVLDNLNLVYHMLKKMNLYSKREEYYDVGLIGLIKAAKTYKPNKHIKFTTYASKCIYNSIAMVLRVENTRDKANKNTISLDQTINIEDKNSISIKDLIPSNYNLEDEIIRKDTIERLNKALLTLSPKEYDIITSLYKINGNKATQIELAHKYNLSQPKISRIHKKILQKLLEQLKSYY